MRASAKSPVFHSMLLGSAMAVPSPAMLRRVSAINGAENHLPDVSEARIDAAEVREKSLDQLAIFHKYGGTVRIRCHLGWPVCSSRGLGLLVMGFESLNTQLRRPYGL